MGRRKRDKFEVMRVVTSDENCTESLNNHDYGDAEWTGKREDNDEVRWIHLSLAIDPSGSSPKGNRTTEKPNCDVFSPKGKMMTERPRCDTVEETTDMTVARGAALPGPNTLHPYHEALPVCTGS